MTDHTYTIEILNEPISFESVSYLNSVKLTEYSAQKKINEHRLGFITKEEIYYNLSKGNKINLDHSYVKDFSVSEYRKLNNLAVNEKVYINSISAVFTFFDCDSVTDFSHTIFSGNVNFKESIFLHGTLNFSYVEFKTSSIDFSECKFHAYRTTFEHAGFSGEKVTFEHANFSGEVVSFINTSFKCDETNFKRANFGSAKVKFHFAEFGNGTKLFERMRFNGPIFDFRRVIFGSGKIDFRRAIFGNGFVTFEESEIVEGKLTFRMARFEGGDLSFRRVDFGKDEANFDNVYFGNRSVSFESVEVSTLSIANSDIHANIDLRVKKAVKIDLSHSYLYSITDLNFLKKDAIEKLSIIGIRNIGKIIIKWKENNVQKLIETNGGKNEEMADQFNVLKDNFSNNGQYDDEDWAYVQFKRHEHQFKKRERLDKYPSLKPFIHVLFTLRALVFDKIGVYATNPNRVIGSMLIAICGYAGIYILFHYLGLGELVNSVDASDNLDIIDKSLYHSAITFFTIGYGDFYPTSFNRLISACEGWTGVFMMSYFTVAFVRKILR